MNIDDVFKEIKKELLILFSDNFKNLMTAIKKSCYGITYETRLDSEEFLKNIDI